MDMEMLERDLARAFGRVSPTVMKDVAETFMRHEPEIRRVFPLVMADLGRHLGTVMMEVGMGVLDKDAVVAVLNRVVSGLGHEVRPKDAA